MKKKQFALLILGIILVGALAWANRETKPTTSSSSSTAAQSFDKKAYALSDPTSIWIVVNKQRPLNPKTYAPNDLVVPNIPLRATITATE
jgi:D-alanyl-D-alanine carboxypeptidase